MENRNLQSSRQIQIGSVPAKWQERFLIKRIDDDDIEISLPEHDAILHALANGERFVQVRKYTLMLNAIKSIEPKWGERNIPPCPKATLEYVKYIDGRAITTYENQKEVDEWHKIFDERTLL